MVVRVWVVRDGRAVAETAEEWLSPRERAQAAEWAVDDRRETFMVSRALQRALGARHLGGVRRAGGDQPRVRALPRPGSRQAALRRRPRAGLLRLPHAGG
ncbi:hypothetical protein GCM10020256_36700 [Streptomyces thermocoprophilus]